MSYYLSRSLVSTAFAVLLAVALVGCGNKDSGPAGTPDSGAAGTVAAASGDKLSGNIRIDGSSTVYPISQAVAELFADEQPDIRVSVSRSGTSAGMGKFLLGEIDICDASRPIKDSELARAKEAGNEVLEFTVGQDGLAVVANAGNDWCDSMTVEQLKAIWRPEAQGEIVNWNQIDESWADVPLKLYGPGTASGTFEYFTEEICGEKKASRSDYTKSEDDNMLVRGVAGDKGGLGYFGFAYYAENKDQLKLIAVDSGDGPVQPSEETVKDGTYTPLSRPLFIYVTKAALQRPEVAALVKFYIRHAAQLAAETQYIPAAEEVQQRNDELIKQLGL